MTDIFTKEATQDFWREQRQRVKDAVTQEEEDQYSFSDLIFPDDPMGLYFHGLEFRYSVLFENCTFQTSQAFKCVTFLKNITFHKSQDSLKPTFEVGAIFSFCNFMGDFDCEYNTFKGLTKFQGCTFHGLANFEGATFDRLIFESEERVNQEGFKKNIFEENAIFTQCRMGNLTAFREVSFESNVSYKKANFYGKTYFDETMFNGKVSFENASFHPFERSDNGFVNIVKCEFKGDSDFWGAAFNINTTFGRNSFEEQVDFRNIKFNREIRFAHNHFSYRLKLDKNYTDSFSRAEDAIVPYRQAKIAAGQQGDSYWQGQFHFQEQCAENARNRKNGTLNPITNRFWSFRRNLLCLWLEVLIGRWIFGYGEKTLRPLLTGLFVVIICAGIFFICGGINYGSLPVEEVASGSKQMAFMASSHSPLEYNFDDGPPRDWHYAGNCFYFSVVTFTTLGYGDFQPFPNMRWLSATEAALGAALMAMFIVSLSRKFVR